jgi:hypothetical protein
MAVVIAVAASALEARAATPGATPPPKPTVPFEIKSIDRATRAQVYVENAWKQNVPGISVSVRTTKEGGSSNAFINAWFYNKDKEPVAKFDKPAQSRKRVRRSRLSRISEAERNVYRVLPSDRAHAIR